MKRVLVPHAREGRLVVGAAEAHHLLHVLRVELDEALEVFDGAGVTFTAQVQAIEGAALVLTLGSPRRPPPLRPVTVVQGLPKGDKLEWVLQKGTELGASAFAVALCARSVAKVAGKEAPKLARWQRIAAEAARQCGRADVPEVYPPAPLLQAVGALPPGTRVLVLDEDERSTTLSQALGPPAQALALVVGPEGGLDRAEVAALVAGGAHSVTLGRLVLRTETAALAALAVVRHLEGVLG